MPTTIVKVALMIAVSAVALTGCRSGSATNAPEAATGDDEIDWFCQEDGDSGEWECIQDDALARDPENARRGSD